MQKDNLEKELSISELETQIKKSKLGSSPGPLGLNYSFFKTFWNLLKYPLLECAQHSFRTKEFPSFMMEGYLTLIPKKKDPRFIQNHRPIILLNCSYKIISSCIANRLSSIIKYIIDPSQTGFISGRYIGENKNFKYSG